MNPTKKHTGFAMLSPEALKLLASKAGKLSQLSGKGHRFDGEVARNAGRKGGLVTAERKRKKALLERSETALVNRQN